MARTVSGQVGRAALRICALQQLHNCYTHRIRAPSFSRFLRKGWESKRPGYIDPGAGLNRKWIAALKVAGHGAAIAKPRLQHPEAATDLAQFYAMSPGINRAAKG
jgi:hypothetical protein